MPENWFDRLVTALAERGRALVRMPTGLPPLDAARQLSRSLVAETGEATGAALAAALRARYLALDEPDRSAFFGDLAEGFAPAAEPLREAAQAYLNDPSADSAMQLAQAAELPRLELLRRFNMARGGTLTLVQMRASVLKLLPEQPHLRPLEADLRHLLASWFNRGFLQVQRIDWNSSASVLEKLIAYEAVHEIRGWEDLRRRLAADRRCFAFFHPAMPDEPLIFIEVAFTKGLAETIEPLLAPTGEPDPTARPAETADTAIFYSISNCQKGLRGISFGNFLIKQVVEELRAELPQLRRFATLSPVPGFRAWAMRETAADAELTGRLARPDWHKDTEAVLELQAPLLRLCARYLCPPEGGAGPSDPVARFHLGNGARLERIDWLANIGPRGIAESWGIMVNYLYDLDRVEANHEAFIHRGAVARSQAVAELLGPERSFRSGVGALLRAGGRR